MGALERTLCGDLRVGSRLSMPLGAVRLEKGGKT